MAAESQSDAIKPVVSSIVILDSSGVMKVCLAGMAHRLAIHWRAWKSSQTRMHAISHVKGTDSNGEDL